MTAPLRVLLVDDEPLARHLLRALLEPDREVAVVGECSGPEAADEVRRLEPEILFLDVQMPGMDGFEVLDELGAERAPVVVFVTAYSQHALRAFEVHALDYLLKPVSDARFAQALARAKERARERRDGVADPRLAALLAERPRYVRRFLVRARERQVVVAADEIDWIEATDYYATLHVSDRSHLLRESLTQLEARLDPECFLRVHRSAIVNLERVREVHPLFRGDAELLLRGGQRVRLSRTHRAEFERRFARPGGA